MRMQDLSTAYNQLEIIYRLIAEELRVTSPKQLGASYEIDLSKNNPTPHP
jgi:hypothetical protein